MLVFRKYDIIYPDRLKLELAGYQMLSFPISKLIISLVYFQTIKKMIDSEFHFNFHG